MIPKHCFRMWGGSTRATRPHTTRTLTCRLKFASAGYKVLYQPLSEVIHYEGATGGTDLTTGTKKHQEINRSTFAERWADELRGKPAPGDLTFLSRPPQGRKNILVIDHHVPMPDKDSGSLRMYQILNQLRQLGHHVTFIPDSLAEDIPPYTRELQKRGIKVFHHPHVKRYATTLSRTARARRCSAKPLRFCAQTHCRRSTARTTEPHHF